MQCWLSQVNWKTAHVHCTPSRTLYTWYGLQRNIFSNCWDRHVLDLDLDLGLTRVHMETSHSDATPVCRRPLPFHSGESQTSQVIRDSDFPVYPCATRSSWIRELPSTVTCCNGCAGGPTVSHDQFSACLLPVRSFPIRGVVCVDCHVI